MCNTINETGDYKCSDCGTMTVKLSFDEGLNGFNEMKDWRVYTCEICGNFISVDKYYGEDFKEGETIYFH